VRVDETRRNEAAAQIDDLGAVRLNAAAASAHLDNASFSDEYGANADIAMAVEDGTVREQHRAGRRRTHAAIHAHVALLCRDMPLGARFGTVEEVAA
jgi:hypothetical protein